MKRLHPYLLILSAFLVAVTLHSCKFQSKNKTEKAGVEYFRGLAFSETPYDIEKGIHSISPEDAKTINSYKFTYDDKGRLVSVEYIRNDKLLGYSSMGRVAKVVYTYGENTQTKHFFDQNDQPIDNQGVFAYQYTLDNDGMRRGLMFLDKDGKMIENHNKIHSYMWSKTPDGMIKENRYNLDGKETVLSQFCPFYELRFTYNDNGYPTRMANYQGDTLYNCTAENCGDIGVSYFSFVPDAQGDITSFTVHNTVGQLSNLYWGWAKRVNTFDPNGYVTETDVYDQDDELLGGKNIPVTQYTYDEHGAVTMIKNLDKNKQLMNDPRTGAAIMEFKYNTDGQRTDTIRYDKDNKELAMK